MIKNIKRTILTIIASFGLLAPALAVGVPVYAQIDTSSPNIQDSVDQGTCLSTTGECTSEDPSDEVDNIVATVINIFSWVVGVTAVIMIIVGGFQYITSGGDTGKVTTAKNTILFAIVGLVIVALAQVIVRFVVQKVTES